MLLLSALAALSLAAPICLEGAEVITPAGPRALTVVIDGGRIQSLGQPPADCAVRDVSGRVITPGLIAAHTQLGLVEVGIEGSTRDADAGGDPVRAAFGAADAYNPASSLIPIARREGLTAAIALPSGGLVSGRAAAVQLAGDSQAEAVIDGSAALVVNLGARGSGSRAQALLELRELLDDARAYGLDRAAYDRGASRDYAASRLDLEALQPVLRGELPLLVHANRASDIEALLRLVDEEDLRVILAGAAEAWVHAEALAERQIPVIINPLLYGPGGFDQLRARPDQAALLAAAGVPVILSSFDTHNARKLRQAAGNAVREGMDAQAALAAITAAPARAFGLEDRGVIAAGARADLVVWSGDPLELTSWPEQVWIGGVERPLESRQTKLRDRYRSLPGTPPPALDPSGE